MTRARPRRPAPPAGRFAFAALAVFLAGCASGSPPPPNESPGFPSGGPVEVQKAPGEPPVFVWERSGAQAVEVRESTRNHVVWAIEAARTPRGPRVISPPLTYGAPALPPGVNPPDGPDYRTTFPAVALVPGATYTVTVRWEGERRSTTAFTVSESSSR